MNNISLNTIDSNGKYGIFFEDNCNNNTISWNTIKFNELAGIFLLSCIYNNITDNFETIYNNGKFGIYLELSNYTIIMRNLIKNHEFGVYLNLSNFNNVSYNIFWDHSQHIVDLGNNNSIILNEYYRTLIISDATSDDDDNIQSYDIFTENFLLIFIFLLLGIISILILYTVVYKGSNKKKIQQQIIPVKSKKKVKHIKDSTQKLELSEDEKKNLEKTESELVIKKREFICVVHKGPILGPNYLCPHCQTFYCVRCANALKEREENCWSCDKKIEL